jgi:hypothetical protein
MDLLLEGANGARVMVMSDACGSDEILDKLIVFDDEAPTALPFDKTCFRRRYQPTDVVNDTGPLPASSFCAARARRPASAFARRAPHWRR